MAQGLFIAGTVWLGIHISHGLGVAGFGLVLLLVAARDFALAEELLMPLAIAFAAVYVVLSVRFWFYGPLLVTGSALACFAASTLLAL